MRTVARGGLHYNAPNMPIERKGIAMESQTMRGRWGLIGGALGAVALMAVALGGCASGALNGGFTITDGSVEVSGAELVVSLECDDATGYEWGETLSGDGLEFDGVEQKSDADNPEGSGNTVGYDVFSFTGAGAGDQTITFTYAAADSPADESKTVTLTTSTNGAGQMTSVKATGSDGSTGSIG